MAACSLRQRSPARRDTCRGSSSHVAAGSLASRPSLSSQRQRTPGHTRTGSFHRRRGRSNRRGTPVGCSQILDGPHDKRTPRWAGIAPAPSTHWGSEAMSSLRPRTRRRIRMWRYGRRRVTSSCRAHSRPRSTRVPPSLDRKHTCRLSTSRGRSSPRRTIASGIVSHGGQAGNGRCRRRSVRRRTQTRTHARRMRYPTSRRHIHTRERAHRRRGRCTRAGTPARCSRLRPSRPRTRTRLRRTDPGASSHSHMRGARK